MIVVLLASCVKNDAKQTEDETTDPVTIPNVMVGDTFFFGTYEQDSVIENGKEKIEWIVLAVEGGTGIKTKALIISKMGLELMEYAEEPPYEVPVWENSSMRRWLNEDFIVQAFGDEERAKICETLLPNPDNPHRKQGGGPDTTDKVFLLSYREIDQYLSDNDRICKVTSEIINHREKSDAIVVTTGACRWWLRTPGRGPGANAYVNSTGAFSVDGSNMKDPMVVRPAMWVTIG